MRAERFKNLIPCRVLFGGRFVPAQVPHAVDAAREAAAAVRAEWRGAASALAMLGEAHPFRACPGFTTSALVGQPVLLVPADRCCASSKYHRALWACQLREGAPCAE